MRLVHIYVMHAFVNHCSVTTQVIQSMVCTISGIMTVVIISEASIERETEFKLYRHSKHEQFCWLHTALIQSSLQMRLLSFVRSYDSIVIAEC